MSYTVDEIKELVRRYGNAMGLGHASRAAGIYETFERAIETYRVGPAPAAKRHGPSVSLVEERQCTDEAPHAAHHWNIKRGTKRMRCLGVDPRPAEGPVASAFLTPVNAAKDHADLLVCDYAETGPCDPRGVRWWLVLRNEAGEELLRNPACTAHGLAAETEVNSGAHQQR
jgi:hypothetical protein